MSAQYKVHSATYPGYSCAFAYIIHCKSAHKRNKIQQQITQCWDHHQTLTHSTFYNISHDPSKPVTKFINTIQSISYQLAAIKHPLHKTEITDMILLCLHESFTPVQLALITHKDKLKLNKIIVSLKEHKAHMVMMSCLPDRTGGSNEISGEQLYFAEMQRKQGGIKRLASKGTGIDWGNSQGQDGVCFHCRCTGHVAAKCIADMPQDVKDKIISGGALFTKENDT